MCLIDAVVAAAADAAPTRYVKLDLSRYWTMFSFRMIHFIKRNFNTFDTSRNLFTTLSFI